MARLPTSGSDAGTWGDMLNQFLLVSHNGDGTLQSSAITSYGPILASNNLSDLQSVPAARINLGLGSAATQSISAFDAAGAAITAQSNAEAASVPITGGTMNGWITPAVVGLTFTTSTGITINAAKGNVFTLTLTANGGTLATPTSPTNGQHVLLCVTQGTGGGFTLSYESGGYNFGTNGQPTLSTTAGDTDVLGFVYLTALGQWLCVGAALGF